jgi:hypothetical protein
MPELVFPMPDADGAPAGDLAAALADEVGRQDAVGLLGSDVVLEQRADRVHVLIQGGTEGRAEAPSDLSRTIVVLLAPPGGECFEQGVELARRAGAAFHVNAAAAACLLDSGLYVRHLQLGYTPVWDRFDPGASPELAIVRDSGGYFDWPAALQAIHGGAVVLHEHSQGLTPLVAGRHLFVGDPAALDLLATALLRDPARLDRVRRQALDFLRDSLPLARAAAALNGAARALVAQPLPAGGEATPGQPVFRSK